MGLKDRLQRLENGEECIVCGWGPNVEVEVVWDDGFDVSEDEKSEYCPVCGNPDTLVITWGDADGD